MAQQSLMTSHCGENLNALAPLLPSGSIVHVFEVIPNRSVCRSIAHVGDGLAWAGVASKLIKSPVGDVAVGRALLIDGDVAATASSQRSHFWLLQAMTYRTFLGVPVWVLGPNKHALIALHSEARQFGETQVLEARICAERVGRTLEREVLSVRSAELGSLEAAGLSYGVMAHEIKNSLVAISISLERVLGALSASDRSKTNLSEEVRALQRHSRELVSVAQFSTPLHRDHRKEVVDVAAVLVEAVRAVRCCPGPYDSIEVVCHGIPNRPKFRCRAEPSALFLAMFSLGLNAMEQTAHLRRKRARIEVSFGVVEHSDGPWVRIDVSDNGPGIPESDYDLVFEPGYTTKPGGRGMGLHLCRMAVERAENGQRRGRVTITESALGVGTTFTVWLPVIQDVG